MGSIKIRPDKIVVEMSIEELIRQPAIFKIPEDAQPGLVRISHVGNLIVTAAWMILHAKATPDPAFRKPKITGGKVIIEFERE